MCYCWWATIFLLLSFSTASSVLYVRNCIISMSYLCGFLFFSLFSFIFRRVMGFWLVFSVTHTYTKILPNIKIVYNSWLDNETRRHFSLFHLLCVGVQQRFHLVYVNVGERELYGERERETQRRKYEREIERQRENKRNIDKCIVCRSNSLQLF